jgi:hypothetical protein
MQQQYYEHETNGVNRQRDSGVQGKELNIKKSEEKK